MDVSPISQQLEEKSDFGETLAVLVGSQEVADGVLNGGSFSPEATSETRGWR